jgi:hypothetical protein
MTSNDTNATSKTEFPKPMLAVWEYTNENGETGYAGFVNDAAINATFSLIGRTQQMNLFHYEGENCVNDARLVGSRDINGKMFYSGQYQGKSVVAFVNQVKPAKGKRAGLNTIVIDVYEAAKPIATTPSGAVIAATQ